MKMNSVLTLLVLILLPVAIGNAETAKPAEADKVASPDKATVAEKAATDKDKEAAEAAEKILADKRQKLSHECIASEAIIADLEDREAKLKKKEAELVEREKEILAQKSAVKAELTKVEAASADQQGVKAKESAEREEKVNKLVETFDGMSPKAAAQVLSGVDDELAVTVLSQLPSVKAGKILANLKPAQSSKFSELMAYGKKNNQNGKENTRVESTERSPASNK